MISSNWSLTHSKRRFITVDNIPASLERKHRLGLEEETCYESREASEIKSTVLQFMVEAPTPAIIFCFSSQIETEQERSYKRSVEIAWRLDKK